RFSASQILSKLRSTADRSRSPWYSASAQDSRMSAKKKHSYYICSGGKKAVPCPNYDKHWALLRSEASQPPSQPVPAVPREIEHQEERMRPSLLVSEAETELKKAGFWCSRSFQKHPTAPVTSD